MRNGWHLLPSSSSSSRSLPLSLFYLTLSGAVVAVWILASLTVFSESHLSSLYPRYCSLAPPFPNRKTVLSGSGLAHQFSLVRIRDARAVNAAPNRPDIVLVFVHGHHGGSDQADTIAYATASAYAAGQKWAEVYAVDFNSGSSAFDGSIALVQVGFLRQALAFVQGLHDGVEVVIIAHSMGGVIARAALAPSFDGRRGRLTTLITINSPLQMHPLLTDPKFTSLYEVADDSLGVALVSIVGGHRDTLVPSTFGVLKQHPDLLTLFTASMPDVWTDLGHDDAMSCTELWAPVIGSIMAAANATRASDRIDIFRRRLQAAVADLSDHRADVPVESMVQHVADSNVYRVLTPAALLSTRPCSELWAPSTAELLDVPLPYESDHQRAKLRDFVDRRTSSSSGWSCMVTAYEPVNITSPHPLSYGAIRYVDMEMGPLSSTSAQVPPGTSAAVVTVTVLEPWSSVLWSGLVPAVFWLNLRRQVGAGSAAVTPLPPELLVIQSDHPASGEMRWYRNPDSQSDLWQTTIAFHPGPSKSLRGRLALSANHVYEVDAGIDLIATLGAGLRLADKSSLISPFVSVVYYHIAALPQPILVSAFVLPLISWASSQFAFDDDWSAPRFGLVLNLVLFWIGIAVLTVVSVVIRLTQRMMRRLPISIDPSKLVCAHAKLVSVLAALLTALLGPWSCVIALWFLVAAKWIRTPSSRFRALALCAYFTVVGLKATLIFAVFHQLETTTTLSWVSMLTDSGPGIGAFFGDEMTLAAPIGLHLFLMLISRGFHDEVDSGARWLRMAAAFTCFVTLSSHYRLFEFIFATSLFAFCCCLEHLRSLLRRSKGSLI